MPSIEERIRRIIVDQLGVQAEEVTESASLVDDLGADSLDRAELVMAFQEAFDMEVSDQDAEKIVTVQDVIDYVQKHSKTVKQ